MANAIEPGIAASGAVEPTRWELKKISMLPPDHPRAKRKECDPA